jgi:hypothetical protein
MTYPAGNRLRYKNPREAEDLYTLEVLTQQTILAGKHPLFRKCHNSKCTKVFKRNPNEKTGTFRQCNTCSMDCCIAWKRECKKNPSILDIPLRKRVWGEGLLY